MLFLNLTMPISRGDGRRGMVAAFALRVLWAVGATAAVIAIGSVSLLFETAPLAISLAFEPLSLFLLPGLAYGLIRAGNHALNTQEMMNASIIFYFCFFLLVSESRALKVRQQARRA